MNRKKIKEAIEDAEYVNNGFQHLSGTVVQVRNLRITKKRAIADIILCSGEDEPTERYNKQEYDLERLEKFFKKEVKA